MGDSLSFGGGEMDEGAERGVGELLARRVTVESIEFSVYSLEFLGFWVWFKALGCIHGRNGRITQRLFEACRPETLKSQTYIKKSL